MEPVVVADECESWLEYLSRENVFLILLLDVEEISLSKEWLWDPPVGIHSIDGYGCLFPVNGDSLIETLLIESEIVPKAPVLIFSLHDFYCVLIDHFDAGNGGILMVSTVKESPVSSLSPVGVFKVVL